MSHLFGLAFVAAVLRISVPYVFAALGGMWSERAGVINIALEGLLLTGAFSATIGGWFGHSAALGLAAGALGGIVIAGLYALLTVWWSGDQIVCGIGINLMVDGGTRFLLKVIFDSSSNSPRIAAFDGERTVSVLGCVGLALAGSYLLLQRTAFGLRLRAVGEHPEAARTLGVSVVRVRALGVLAAGLLAGTGGAWMAADQKQFVAAMSNGRGYIALAALILGKWRPLSAALAAVLFAAAEATQIVLSTQGGWAAHYGWALQMLPYLLTMVALAGLIGHSRAPAALGKTAS